MKKYKGRITKITPKTSAKGLEYGIVEFRDEESNTILKLMDWTRQAARLGPTNIIIDGNSLKAVYAWDTEIPLEAMCKE